MMELGLIIVGIFCVVLMFQRWCWLIVFGIASLVSCIALLASIIHFQIFGALGFFILMLICWKIAKSIANGYPAPDEKPAQEIHLPSKLDGPDWSPR